MCAYYWILHYGFSRIERWSFSRSKRTCIGAQDAYAFTPNPAHSSVDIVIHTFIIYINVLSTSFYIINSKTKLASVYIVAH